MAAVLGSRTENGMEIVAARASTSARCSVEWRPPSGRSFEGCALRWSVATALCVCLYVCAPCVVFAARELDVGFVCRAVSKWRA